jgi:hypothetical protein
MRSIAFLIVVAELVLLGPLFVMYGQVDPCRALAKELASRAEAAGGLGTAVEDAFGNLEVNARREIANKSTGECTSGLISSWGGRVTGG